MGIISSPMLSHRFWWVTTSITVFLKPRSLLASKSGPLWRKLPLFLEFSEPTYTCSALIVSSKTTSGDLSVRTCTGFGSPVFYFRIYQAFIEGRYMNSMTEKKIKLTLS